MKPGELEKLAELVVDKIMRRLDLRALAQRSERKTECDEKDNIEEMYAFTTTEKQTSTGYKSPAQIARELLTRAPRRHRRRASPPKPESNSKTSAKP